MEELDDIVPTRSHSMIPLVGLGGSAGSIPALKEFFQTVRPDTGMAFVVVVHLAPAMESMLPQLLGQYTDMPVTSVVDGVTLEADHVYVIPPGKHLTTVDGQLRLTTLEPEHGKRIAVDLFFRSLADTHGPDAAAIVLSGADGDGAIGIKRIKEQGGLTIAQDPEEAEHRGMPQAAIATGMVDLILRVAEMPGRLIGYRGTETKLQLPPEEGAQPIPLPLEPAAQGEAALREVLLFLRSRTGHDFSYYKRATIVRRISRRMQVNEITELQAYLAFFRMHPEEIVALQQDLLISVTNFFRDRDAFAGLERLIPEVFRDKGPDDFVRIWVPACATGEEAYSLAMLLLEHTHNKEKAPTLQLFGSDLDENAIEIARIGRYPDTIAADVNDERLHRFFVKEPGGFRVRREVREIILFARHDLLKDAPFSRLDLVSCRNLLIYLNQEAQKRVLDIFHFALRPHGLLFLGSSESADEGNTLFRTRDKKHRIYELQPTRKTGLPVPSGPSSIMRALELQEKNTTGTIWPSRSSAQPIFSASISGRSPIPFAWDELHLRLIERLAPPSVVVNADYDVVHLSEEASRFVRLGGGVPSLNLLRAVPQGLRIELRGALFRAVESGSEVEVPAVPVELEGATTAVGLRVLPAPDLAPGHLLVVFEARPPIPGEVVRLEPNADPELAVRQLERELEGLREHLRVTVQQYEANTEELKAGNEELQAMNEELRSASEELETSREELQSINEELTTVNQELKNKVDELRHTNSDLHNLMSSTAIATVFLDRDLRITRFTPSAVSLFNLIPGDVGRPLSDLQHRLDYYQIGDDAIRVLGQLVPVEREISANDGRAFLARLLPYRTLDDRIAGVVLTFVDITEGRRAEEALQQRNDELERFNRAAVGRELRMLELKREINELLARRGEPPRYVISGGDETPQ